MCLPPATLPVQWSNKGSFSLSRPGPPPHAIAIVLTGGGCKSQFFLRAKESFSLGKGFFQFKKGILSI